MRSPSMTDSTQWTFPQHTIASSRCTVAANGAVLVVDDSEAFRYAIGRSLAREGYRVLEASNGDEALDQIVDNEVKALVVDLVMPGLSGVELLRVLSQRKGQRPIHVIACTGALPITAQLRQTLASIGVTRVLEKPFSTDELLQALRDRR